MTKEADDAFMNSLRQKFLEVADWPVEQRVAFKDSVAELVTHLGDGTLARGKRTAGIRPHAAVATPPEKMLGEPRADNPIKQRQAELRSASVIADDAAKAEAVKQAEKPADEKSADKSPAK